jgi:hypothetical protein
VWRQYLFFFVFVENRMKSFCIIKDFAFVIN